MHVAYIFSFLNTVINEEVIFKYYIFRRNLFMSTSTTYEEQKVKKTKSKIRKKWEELDPETRDYLKAGLLFAVGGMFMSAAIGEYRAEKRLMKEKLTLWSVRYNCYCTKSREDINAWIKNETLSKRELFSLNKEALTLLDAADTIKNNGATIKIEYNDK
jgi:hypothetical protein